MAREVKYLANPQPGWFSLKSKQRESHGASKAIRRAGHIWRYCMCTIQYSLTHQWGESCDRYPHTLMASVDGWPASVEHVWVGGEPISEIEALSLMGQENLYV